MKVSLSVLAALLTFSSTFAQNIFVDSYPQIGYPGYVYGHVDDSVDPDQFVIALVIDVFGTIWSKPFFQTPYVTIGQDRRFAGQFITGGEDRCAQRIYLFLVPVGSSIPLASGGSSIPPSLYSMSLTNTVIDRTTTSNPIVWSGLEWDMKDTGTCTWGPGPNYFSPTCVRTDGNELHLFARYEDGVWKCGEIISRKSFGWGRYLFRLSSDLRSLETNFVVGMFTYSNDPEYNHREVDIEYSKGPVVGSDAPWQFVVQPWLSPDLRHRFNPGNEVPTVGTFTRLPGTTSFSCHDQVPTFDGTYKVTYGLEICDLTFYPDHYLFNQYSGVYFSMTAPGLIRTNIAIAPYIYDDYLYRLKLVDAIPQMSTAAIESWSTRAGLPTGNEKVHLNVWIYGNPPADTNTVCEVVFSGFEFTPISPDCLAPNFRMSNVKIGDYWTPTTFDSEIQVPGK